MKRRFIYGAVTLWMLALTAGTRADIPAPKPPPNEAPNPFTTDIKPTRPTTPKSTDSKGLVNGRLTIATDSTASGTARLQIPRGMVKELQAQLAASEAGTAAPAVPPVAQSSTPVIMSGLFLFLAISATGIWLLRSPGRPRRKAIAAVAIGAALTGATVTIANANMTRPQNWSWSGFTRAINEGQPAEGSVAIEIVDDYRPMTLTVPIKASAFGGKSNKNRGTVTPKG